VGDGLDFWSCYSQGRQVANVLCIHCGRNLPKNCSTKDHVPSKFLLSRPFPDNLATIRICSECNSGTSLDEEYFAAFLGMMLTSGEGEELHPNEPAIDSNFALQNVFEGALGIERSGGLVKCYIEPDLNRLHRVIEKNARGHWHLADRRRTQFLTTNVICCALESQPDEVWEKVMPPASLWSVIQKSRYRFHLELSEATIVRSVISDYLYTETHLMALGCAP